MPNLPLRAAIRLWYVAWKSRPAGSLPPSAGRRAASAGFVLCSDGRWHHPTIADAATAHAQRRKRRRGRKG